MRFEPIKVNLDKISKYERSVSGPKMSSITARTEL